MSNRPVTRGRLIGRGGEGDVYDIPDQPGFVAKIYHRPPSPERVAKLEAMIAHSDSSLTNIAAWPVKLLQDRGSSTVRGFVMPKIAGYQTIHHLYSPKSRLSAFPEADFRFLVHTGMNIASAFERIHQAGCVIGDVNYGNVLVSPRATVALIDCDSFQVRDGWGRILRCEVGEPTFIPPELQSLELRTVDRTINHDAFGLAILIFHLLFQGRHPFSGRYLGHGDMGIERAIKEHRFAYGRTGRAKQMEPPPNSLQLTEISREAASFFEQAFAPENSGLGKRPSPAAWRGVLERMLSNVRKCSTNAAHYFLAPLPNCPWCAIEARGAIVLFQPKVHVTPPAPGTDVGGLWAAIEAVVPPIEVTAPLPQSQPLPPPSSAALAASRAIVSKRVGGSAIMFLACLFALNATGIDPQARWIIGLVGGFVGLLLFIDTQTRTIKRRFQEKELEASRAFTDLQHLWNERGSNESFFRKHREFFALKSELERLGDSRKEQLSKLRSTQADRQKRAYLETFEVADASIDGVGASRKAALLSYGVENAYDVTSYALGGVPGFGPVLIQRMLRWRASIESRFRFDPSKPLDPRAVQRIEQDIRDRRAKLEADLRAGAGELARLKASIEQQRIILGPKLAAAAGELRSAQADLRALP